MVCDLGMSLAYCKCETWSIPPLSPVPIALLCAIRR